MADDNPGVTPAPAATPPATPPTPPAEPEKVTVTKEEFDKLKADAAEKDRAIARAASAQSKADKLAGNAGKKTLFGKETPQPSAEQLEAEASQEYQNAVGEVTKLALDPRYREVMDNDPTLRNLIAIDPGHVIRIYANNAVDAEDAKGIIEDMFKERLAVIQKEKGGTPPAEKEEKKEDLPPGGAPNPSGNQAQEQAMDAAKKITNPEDRRAAMIRAKLGNSTI